MIKFFKKHKKQILCGFLVCVFCSVFAFNCFADSYTFRTYSDLTSTNTNYLALSEMAEFTMQNANLIKFAFRTETETHLLVLDSQGLDNVDWHDSYFVIPAQYVLVDYYYLNSVPVGYGNNTRYFVRYQGEDYSEDDSFRLYVNHAIVSNIDWGLNTPTFVDVNIDMSNFTYMFLTIVILLVFIIIMRMR